MEHENLACLWHQDEECLLYHVRGHPINKLETKYLKSLSGLKSNANLCELHLQLPEIEDQESESEVIELFTELLSIVRDTKTLQYIAVLTLP